MKASEFNWGPGLFVIGYHLLLIVSLPLYFLNHTPSWGILLSSFVLLYLTGLSITGGYHRLYAHTSYKARTVLEYIYLFFGTMATQGSVIRWSYDHRLHHAFVDTDKDPYSIKKGFWYAHWLWLFEKPKPIEERVVADLYSDPVLRFQDKYYPYLMFATNILAALFVGWLCGDYLGGFLFAWLVRLLFLHHFTWFINSLAHTWGARTFSQELSAVDNFLISLVTFGEGYHNYHHAFSKDYRNGIRWYHFDPAKWLIWALSKVGLAYKLKHNSRYFIEEQIILDRKRLLLEAVQATHESHDHEREREKITQLSESILTKLADVKKLHENFKTLRKEKAEKSSLKALAAALKEAKRNFKKEHSQWNFFARHILASAPHLSSHGH